MQILARALSLLWVGFWVLFVAGGKTVPVFRGVFALSALGISVEALFFRRGSRPVSQNLLRLWDRFITRRLAVLFVAAICAAVALGMVLDYESLNGTLWDLGQYISGVFHLATQGVPAFFFHGGRTSTYHHVHSSISLYLIAGLYGVFLHSWIVVLWQAIFLCLPGWVALLWARSVARRSGFRGEGWWYWFAALTWFSSPVFLGQQYWPYTFHVAGMSILALGYWAYYENRALLWLACMIVLPLEKEDFGAISASFGGLVMLEGLISVFWGKRGSRARPNQKTVTWGGARAMLLGGFVAAFGLGYFLYFSKHFAQAVPFSSKFGHIAATPSALLLAFYTRPLEILSALSRPLSAKYLWYFVSASLLWRFPRWRVVKYFIPVAPVLFLNSIAVAGPMQLFKDHYALPIAVGLSATLVLGVFAELARQEAAEGRGNRVRRFVWAGLAAFLSLTWNHESPVRGLRHSLSIYQERVAERNALESLRHDPSIVVCCEDRLCSTLMERPLVLEARYCLGGSGHLARARGGQAVFVTYASSQLAPASHFDDPLPLSDRVRVPIPQRWRFESSVLRVSEPVLIPFQERL